MEKTEDRIMAGQNHKEKQFPMILSCHGSVAGPFGCGWPRWASARENLCVHEARLGRIEPE